MSKPSLSSRPWRLALFTTLYLYQGLVAGFATTALVNHFAAAGASVAEIGRHLAVVGLPWVLQPLLWGPLVDAAGPRRMGPRRFWLAVAVVGAQAALAGLALVGERPSLTSVSVLLFGHSLLASLADTATDRMLAESVPEPELGRTSACTRAGFVGGSAVGTALFAWLLGTAGFAATAAVLLALTTALAGAALCVRERPEDALLSVRVAAVKDGSPRRPRRTASALLDAVALLGRRQAALLLLICFGVDAALAVFQVPFAVAMVQGFGWEAASLSRLQALLGVLGGTVGAGVIGILVDRAGPHRAMRGLFLACAAAFAAVAILIGLDLAGLLAPLVLGLASVVPALLYVALLPACVLASRQGGASATQFQVFMAAMNLGDVAGAAFADEVALRLGSAAVALLVGTVFLICAAFRPSAPPGAREGCRDAPR